MLRRPLDTVDLEELPDSCERTGAPVLFFWWRPNRRLGAVLWQFLSAILDRQGLMVATPVDLRKKAESFSPQAWQGFWSRIKIKNPKIVVMSQTVFTKYTNQKEVMWQQYRLCLTISEYLILCGKHFLFFAPESGKILVVREAQYGLSCEDGNPSEFFIILEIFYNHMSSYQVRVSDWFQRNDKFVQFFEMNLEGESDFDSSVSFGNLRKFREFRDTRGSSIGHEFDQGPPSKVETSEFSAGHHYRPSNTQLSKEYDCRYSARSWKMRVIGLRETTDPSRESIGKCTSVLPNMQLECCMIIQGTLADNFDIFAARGESTTTTGYFSGKPVQDPLAWGFVL